MTNKINGPFGSYSAKSPGGILNALHAEGVPLTTVERVIVSFDTSVTGTIVEDDKTIATFKYFPDLDKTLFLFQVKTYGKQTATWDEEGKLRPKFKLSLYHHGSSSLVVSKHKDGDLFTQELFDFVSDLMSANISHVTADSSDYMKEENQKYLIKQEAGAFFQGGSSGFDQEFIYIEFWKPAGAQAFVDYINKNFYYEGVNQPPVHSMEVY